MTLKDRVDHMKRLYWWKTGNAPDYLFVPRYMLKEFCAALSDEIDGIGPKHHVYHWLSTGERELEVFDLKVRIGGDDRELAVGVDA